MPFDLVAFKKSILDGEFKKAKTFLIDNKPVIVVPIGAKFICAACLANSSKDIEDCKTHAASVYGLHHALGQCQAGKHGTPIDVLSSSDEVSIQCLFM